MEQHIPRHIAHNSKRIIYPGGYNSRIAPGHTALSPEIARRYRVATPLLFMSVIIESIGLGIGVFAVYFNSKGHMHIADVLVSVGIILLGIGAIPFLFGIYLLLRKPIHQHHRCGMCAFYRAESTSYALGQCDRRDQHLTTRLHTCEDYRYSERAMVRDRLSSVPQRLKPTM